MLSTVNCLSNKQHCYNKKVNANGFELNPHKCCHKYSNYVLLIHINKMFWQDACFN